MMPTLKTCQVAPELYFRHVDPKSIVKSHRENVLCLHGMENGGLPLIRSMQWRFRASPTSWIFLEYWKNRVATTNDSDSLP